MSFKTPGISARRIRICRSQSCVTCCQISSDKLPGYFCLSGQAGCCRHHRQSEYQDSNLRLAFTALAPSRPGRYSEVGDGS